MYQLLGTKYPTASRLNRSSSNPIALLFEKFNLIGTLALATLCYHTRDALRTFHPWSRVRCQCRLLVGPRTPIDRNTLGQRRGTRPRPRSTHQQPAGGRARHRSSAALGRQHRQPASTLRSGALLGADVTCRAQHRSGAENRRPSRRRYCVVQRRVRMERRRRRDSLDTPRHQQTSPARLAQA
jgi:hypothetical protein